MSKVYRVTILVDTTSSFGRGIVRGILKYARIHGPWSFYTQLGWKERGLPRLKDWGAHGLINFEVQKSNKSLDETTLPAVFLYETREPVEDFPTIICENETIGRLGAEHFIERGFTNFAFFGFKDISWSQERCKGFASHLKEHGFKTEIFDSKRKDILLHYNSEQIKTLDWLKDLAKPTCIMACDDYRGQYVLETCRLAGIRVPEEISVLGVNDDEFVCELTEPPLSSITLDTDKAGYHVAKILDKLMKNKKPDSQFAVIEPIGISTRRSTDILAVDNPDLAKALHFIRENAKHGLQVIDVLEAVNVPRRTLYLLFQKYLHRSIHYEINRVRMRHVRQMLIETDMTIDQIARSIGSDNSKHIARTFKKFYGMTPLSFRKKHRVS